MEKSFDILEIQGRAVARKALGADVINGCAGMLFRDDKNLCVYPMVDDVIRARFENYLTYPPIVGTPAYANGVLEWIFEDSLPQIKAQHSVSVSATLGGTGALAMVFERMARRNGIALLTDVCWPNYRGICREHRLPFLSYPMFHQDNTLALDEIAKAIEAGLGKADNVLLVINDPCHNPSGYCMSEADYQGLFDLLSHYGKKVTLLMDIAYMDYAPMGFLFPKMLLSHSIDNDVFIAFSCSKSFGLYGMRLGALIQLGNKDWDLSSDLNEFRLMARGTYSCPNNTAMGPMAEVLADVKTREAVRDAIHRERERLQGIGNSISDMLTELHIPHYPYKGGFYLTFIVEDSKAFCEKLEQADIYFSPAGPHLIRIAASGLNAAEVIKLKGRLAAL